MNAHTQVAVTRPSLDLVAGMAQGYGMEAAAFEKTIVATCFPSEKDRPSVAEFCGFLLVAKQYGLNPLTREIFGFRAKSGAIVPVVSVDGWVNLINSHPAMNGLEFDDHAVGAEVEAITCRIWRKDREKPIVVTEYMAECKRDADKTPWGRWPRRMLRHKALIQCARYAFGFAGIHDPDEAERMGADVSALREIPPDPPTPSDPAPAGGEPAETAKATPEPEVTAGTAHDKDGVVWEEEGERAATVNDVPEPPTPGAAVDTTEDADGTPAFLKRTAKAPGPAKAEPKPEPKAEAPKVEPKPAAKATPKAEPKAADPEPFDVAQWLKDLEGACGGCETLDQLIDVQNKIQIPAKKHVTSKTDWQKGKDIVLAASGRILGDSSDEP